MPHSKKPALFSSGILGVGSAVPEKVMTNTDWSKLVDTTDEWIRTRTGILERRIAEEDTTTCDLATEAAKKALANAKIKAKDLDMIVVGTTTPDFPVFPSAGAVVQHKLGISEIPAFDVSAACTGFIYAMSVADQFVKTGAYKRVLVIGADTLSKYVDKTDRNVCVLFGDGAGAVVLGPVEEGYGILSSCLKTRGSGHDLLKIEHGGSKKPLTEKNIKDKKHYIKMNGKEVFKFAVSVIGEAIEEALKLADLKAEDVDWLIPHQANTRIIDAAKKRLGLSEEKVYVNISRYGNTSAASIPLAMDELAQAGRLKKGDIIATVGFGAGLTWGANVIRWSK
ncbi:beta-ketoacyl-ACP synthase III [Candidatus Margulisiibacteriota bacterium]